MREPNAALRVNAIQTSKCESVQVSLSMDSKFVQLVPLNQIEVRSNVRERLLETEQDELSESIKQNGIRVPCIGYEDGPRIVPVDGHRRIDAAIRAGEVSVPMLLVDHVPSPTEILILQLVVNCHRSSLKPTERARAIQRLMQESGWSAAQVSTKLSEQSQSMISKLLTLLVHPKEVQDLIDSGRIPISSAYALATVADADDRQRLVAEILDGSLKRDQLVKRIKLLKNESRRASRPRNANRPPRERFTVFMGAGRAITVTGPNLTLRTAAEWLQVLLDRINALQSHELGLAEAVKALAVSLEKENRHV